MEPKALSTILRGEPAGWRGRGGRLRVQLRTLLLTLATLAVVVSLLASSAGGALAQSPEATPYRFFLWDTQRADAPKMFYNMGNHSFRLDKSGYGHVAYGGDHLYYAYFNGTSYIQYTVDGGTAVGQYASLALDANGTPHISYYDAYNGLLKYARMIGAGPQWQVEVVDTPPAETMSITPEGMQLEQNVGPVSDWEDPLVQRPWQESILQSDNADNLAESSLAAQGGVGMYSSIAIDSEGRPHISYYDAINRDLKYAYRDNSYNPPRWIIDTAVHRNDVGTWSSLVIGPNDLPLMSFMDETNDDLNFVFGKVGDWEPVEVADGGDVRGGYTSIAYGKDGRVYISYYNCGERTSDSLFACSKGDLKFAVRKGQDNWDNYTVESKNNVGGWTSLAMDGNNKAHISYYDFSNGDLRYATGSGSSWNISLRASAGDVGRYSSIAVDSNANAHIAYLDFDAGELRETYKSGSSWPVRTIDMMRDVGYSTSLEFTLTGLPFISYFDNTFDDLKAASLNGVSWQQQNIATTNSIGQYSSLEIDGADRPRMAYYDATNGDLKYAYWTGTQWAYMNIEVNKRDVGRFVSMDLNSIYAPAVSYYDATNRDLMYASWNVTAQKWVSQTVDTKDDVGLYTSLAIDDNDNPHISYYDATNGALKYAFWNGVEWIRQTVDDDDDDVNPSIIGWHTSLALDAAGRPHISYYECGLLRDGECTQGDLKYAYWDGSAWRVSLVDGRDNPALGTKVDVGAYTSLAIDHNGQRYISYYDITNKDLKLAHYNGLGWILYVVDNLGDVGRYTSVALDPNGNPNISYYDFTNGDLKLAAGTPVDATGLQFLPLTMK